MITPPKDSHIISIKDEANKLLDQNEKIKNITKDLITSMLVIRKAEIEKIAESCKSDSSCKELYDKATNYYGNQNNIYIFDFAELASLVDIAGATHIMIIEGAQQDAKNGFKKGQSTIIIAPCIDAGASDNQGNIFKTKGDTALEHPQFRFERTIPFEKKPDYIEVIKSE